jgi:hypothetical protein
MFKGSIPALVTPFRDGSFDEAAFRRLVDWQIDSGSSALVPCGTTGEASTMDNAEHYRVIEVCVEQAAGRVPVIAGCGSNDTRTAVGHLKAAKERGADAALCVAPYYNRPSQEGLLAHFSQLAENSELPIVLYNVPGRTVTDMLPATVVELASASRQDRRPQGRQRRPAARGDAADRGGRGLLPALGRRPAGPRRLPARPGRLHLGHRQRRAEAVRRVPRRRGGGRLRARRGTSTSGCSRSTRPCSPTPAPRRPSTRSPRCTTG